MFYFYRNNFKIQYNCYSKNYFLLLVINFVIIFIFMVERVLLSLIISNFFNCFNFFFIRKRFPISLILVSSISFFKLKTFLTTLIMLSSIIRSLLYSFEKLSQNTIFRVIYKTLSNAEIL